MLVDVLVLEVSEVEVDELVEVEVLVEVDVDVDEEILVDVDVVESIQTPPSSPLSDFIPARPDGQIYTR